MKTMHERFLSEGFLIDLLNRNPTGLLSELLVSSVSGGADDEVFISWLLDWACERFGDNGLPSKVRESFNRAFALSFDNGALGCLSVLLREYPYADDFKTLKWKGESRRSESNVFIKACENDDVELLDLLVDRYGFPDIPHVSSDAAFAASGELRGSFSSIWLSAIGLQWSHIEPKNAVLDYLIGNGWSPVKAEEDGEVPPLVFACSVGNFLAASRLLSEGCSPWKTLWVGGQGGSANLLSPVFQVGMEIVRLRERARDEELDAFDVSRLQHVEGLFSDIWASPGVSFDKGDLEFVDREDLTGKRWDDDLVSLVWNLIEPKLLASRVNVDGVHARRSGVGL